MISFPDVISTICDGCSFVATFVAPLMISFLMCQMFIYKVFGGENLLISIPLLLINGVLVNGPYSLICSAVAQNLGQHPSLKGAKRAVATVTGIINGTGSIGKRLFLCILISLSQSKLLHYDHLKFF